MKRKIIIATVAFIAVFLPIVIYAQTPDGSAQRVLQFISGDGAFEKWFMEVFTKLDTNVDTAAVAASMVGRSIGGLGVLMYLGYLGFQMQNGERNWDVTPMIRPIIIGFILLNWASFTAMLQYPLQKLAEPSAAIFSDIEKDVDDVRVARFEKQTQLVDFLISEKAKDEAQKEQADAASDGADKSWLADGLDKLLQPIKEYALRMDFWGQRLLASFIEAISLMVLRVCVYFIFFIQKVWAYILIILGPIAVGMSLVPGFESSFSHWVSKFININLYTFIAYTVINIGQQMIMAGYQMEIDRYDLMLNNGNTSLDTVMTYIMNNGMIYSVLFPCVAYLVTGIGVLMTPKIADAIVSGGGASAIMSGAGRNIAKGAKGAVKVAKTAAKLI